MSRVLSILRCLFCSLATLVIIVPASHPNHSMLGAPNLPLHLVVRLKLFCHLLLAISPHLAGVDSYPAAQQMCFLLLSVSVSLCHIFGGKHDLTVTPDLADTAIGTILLDLLAMPFSIAAGSSAGAAAIHAILKLVWDAFFSSNIDDLFKLAAHICVYLTLPMLGSIIVGLAIYLSGLDPGPALVALVLLLYRACSMLSLRNRVHHNLPSPITLLLASALLAVLCDVVPQACSAGFGMETMLPLLHGTLVM
ncbi:hypothetical protein MKEN_00593100 [Mycena kentingensis (nom. inval.)]|nr:hypothetical protein MKEN_00593100 [Mycena kentingensis (nom. inval.)]